MRRLVIILTILVLNPLLIQAQTELDSLLKSLQGPQSDSSRFVTFIRISEASEFYDFQKARVYADEASRLAEKIDKPWAYAKIKFRLGTLESTEGDFADALRLDQECVNLYGTLGDSTELARSMNDVGQDYRFLGAYSDAYATLTKSYTIAKSSHRVATHGDSLIMAIALHNMGSVFTELGQYDIALSHLTVSMELSKKLNDKEGEPYSYSEMGEVYRRKGDFAKAEEVLQIGLRESKLMKIRLLIPRIMTTLAQLYADQKDYSKALAYYDSVETQCTAVNNRYGLAQGKLGRGKVLSTSGREDAALQLYLESLQIAKEMNSQNLELECYKELSKSYQARKEYERALAYLQNYESHKENLFSESSIEKLFQDQVRFETANKDTEIATLSQLRMQQTNEIRRQELIQNVLVIVIALVVILLFTVYRSGSRRKRINKLLLEHQQEIKRRSADLEPLNEVKDKFFSIISHDLRSPMNALGATLDLLEQQHISPDEFRALSKTLRSQFNHTRTLINNLLDWTLLQMDKLKIQPERIVISQKVTESFKALNELFPKNITMENNVDPGIEGFADSNILNLVLRNLILNAIKFTQSGGRIEVSAIRGEREITIAVADTGIGIRPEVQKTIFEKTSGYSTRGTANEKGTGLGLILSKEFVEKNGGRIWLESVPEKGSTFYFTLPRAV